MGERVLMPLYEYENKKTGKRWTEHLPIHKRNFPCRNPFVKRVISAPNLSIISDVGGKEDKARDQLRQAAESGYKEQEIKDKLGIKKISEHNKEKREKKKQKFRWF
jgi:hypothetical protein